MKKLVFLLIMIQLTTGTAQTVSNWMQVPTPTTKDLHCIVFPSPQIGYIGGSDSLLLKTTNGGNTWTEVSFSGITFLPGGADFLELDFITEEIGYATIGPYTGTYRTSDGGLTWTALNTSPSMCYNHGLYFLADGEGFVGGSGCFQGELMDRFVLPGVQSQANINAQLWDANNMIVDIDFDLDLFASVGLAVSTGGRILRTTDSGLNWDTIASPLGNQVPLTTVTIVNPNLAFIGYDNNGMGLGLLVSTDGGLTWAIDGNSSTFAYPIFHDLHTTVSDKVFCGTTATTLNSGYILECWDMNAPFPMWMGYAVDEPIYSMTSHSDTIVWGAGKNGYLVKRGNQGPVSVNEQQKQEPIALFPNPAGVQFTVDLPKTLMNAEFIIEVYSLDGKWVKQGGKNENTLNVEDLETGNYIVHVSSEKGGWNTTLIKE
jgi:photosystem II stability/assembly factor-like uncharacterized protein